MKSFQVSICEQWRLGSGGCVCVCLRVCTSVCVCVCVCVSVEPWWTVLIVLTHYL